MSLKIVPIHRNDSREEGMLFVRTEGILETMVRASLLVAGLFVMALCIPLQSSFGSTRSLDLIIYPDGSTHISTLIDVDPLTPDFEIELFGPSVDNFVATGENGFLLSSEIFGNKATIDTFGSSVISIDYDIHDLVSKEGRVWTFAFDSPTDYTLILPENSVIVGMNVLPNSMEIIDEHTKLELSGGFSEINYIFGTSTNSSPSQVQSENSFDISNAALLGGPIVAAAIGAGILIRRKKKQTTIQIPKESHIDLQEIFSLRPDMREDDKEIVKFISENGGEVLESDLRKKFLQPRTTMWRAVKRLERLGIVEIIKKDMQNLVKIRENMEDEK